MNGKIIIYVGGFILPDGNAAAQRVLSNAKAFRLLGYQVVFIGTDKNIKKNRRIFDTYFKTDFFDCYKVPYPITKYQWLLYISSIKSIIQVIKKYGKKNIYAIIAYNYPSIALYKLRKYSNNSNIKLIADCTEWYSSSKIIFPLNIIKWMDTAYRMKYCHKKIGNVICISNYLEKYYNNIGCNTVNIPPLIDKNESKWNIGSKYCPNIKRTFVYAGSPGIKAQKDRIDLIIDAFYELKMSKYSYKLYIIGINKEIFLKQLTEYNEKLKIIDKSVIFLGEIPHKDVIHIIRKADFTIFIRNDNRLTRAGFPTKLVESLTCGSPPITNSTSNIGQFINDGINGFLVENISLEALKNVLKRVINIDNRQLKKIHKECRKNNQFDYKLYLEKINSFLNKAK